MTEREVTLGYSSFPHLWVHINMQRRLAQFDGGIQGCLLPVGGKWCRVAPKDIYDETAIT